VQLRRNIWIHTRFQAIWIGRVIIYWSAAMLYFGLATAVSQYHEFPEWSFSRHCQAWWATVGPWLPSAAIILPLVLYDVVRLSEQFIGPVLRARRQLSKIVNSANCTPFLLRADDYWHELIEPMNDIQNYVLSLQLELHRSREALAEAGIDLSGRNSKIVCLDTANLQVIDDNTGAS
jgi:hypothetical protein